MIVSFASDVTPPARFPSPFGPAHPLAVAAAQHLMARLDPAPREGKMFGVLVVPGGYLRAFSGMLDGAWLVDGFAPPLFDLAARDAFWIAGEQELRDRAAAIDAASAAVEVVAARHAEELAALRAQHELNKAQRARARLGLAGRVMDGVETAGATADDRVVRAAVAAITGRSPRRASDPQGAPATLTAMQALDQASRADTAAKRALDARHAEERARLPDLAALVAARAARSRELLHAIHRTYRIDLRALFAPGEPPGGAGDCAAPKLLAHARALGLRPIALAELWWGPPPATGDRRHGTFYPACRGKCGPILPLLLPDDAEAAPVFGGGAIDTAEPRVIHEDAWLAIVEKPVGLLSVPGRSGHLRDSVLVRVQARWPEATVVHRLDLDTSGLMLVAKDAGTHAALQRAFAERRIDKRYVAWLDGPLMGQAGIIELPIRVDLDDRPRQIVDHAHGKPAITEWRVIAREPGRTRVALIPRTGRTHQLRVHAAQGLGVPIQGDRLYGRAAERMFLHAESIAIVHPHTGERVAVERPPQW